MSRQMIVFVIVGLSAILALINLFCCTKKDPDEELMNYLENKIDFSEETIPAV
jgi:uncharacterized membrane protein YuzA (DUF378 family)